MAKAGALEYSLGLCELEIVALDREGSADSVLFRIRMDTISVNMRMARHIMDRDGYSLRQKTLYNGMKGAFLRLQNLHGVFWDNDEL